MRVSITVSNKKMGNAVITPKTDFVNVQNATDWFKDNFEQADTYFFVTPIVEKEYEVRYTITKKQVMRLTAVNVDEAFDKLRSRWAASGYEVIAYEKDFQEVK